MTSEPLSVDEYQLDGDLLEISSEKAHEWITGIPVEVRE